VGIWWRDRYRRYSADRAYRLFVVRTRRIVIFRTCVADIAHRHPICLALYVVAPRIIGRGFRLTLHRPRRVRMPYSHRAQTPCRSLPLCGHAAP
jgi:hypothetical protein